MSVSIRVFAIATAFAVSSVQASAELPIHAQTYLNQSIQKLDTIARIRRAEGSLPTLADARDAKILEALWDRKAILGNGPYRSTDVPILLDIFEKENAVFKTYMLYSSDPQKLPQTDQNAAFFQNEVSRSSAFLLTVCSSAVEALADFVAQLKPGEFNDARRQGLQQTRLGIQEFVSSAMIMMRSPALRAENRVIIADALQENAKQLAATMSIMDRQALAAIASTVTTPEIAPQLRSFTAAMQSTDCVGLCLIP